ncbi:Fructosamine/Ketosamine-3-kinase [Schizothecium vesticola]|uniref:protein-ribulosamine 3-kinase n=1 Tax=Schizothecium vesticola TaxID=314040 RepID=A0AA40EWN2_9PEZI|nr:Fructosamine/Ketosamine-3-kinase [Schizothecium vesticola]
MNYSGAPGLEFGGGNVSLDPAVIAQLPDGCTVVSTEGHGVSFWANTGRIDVELPNGTEQSFFIKVLSGETGRHMVQAEYESMKAICSVTPDFAPKPIAAGAYDTLPDTHFFLCEFRDLLDELPEPQEFTTRLAALHQNSKSPTGKFGFHTSTYPGNLPQVTEWEDSWEIFFSKSLKQALDLEIKAKGSDPEMEQLLPIIFDRVVPRLLRPLETDGRSVKPSLVHGDLWYANSGLDAETGGSLIFDACCFYAHNEYEFGQWRPACNRFDDKYLDAYHQRVNRSAPEEDYDGRLDLYKL